MNNELIERIDARHSREALTDGPYDGELMTLLEDMRTALSQAEPVASSQDVEPYEESVARLRYDSEDLEALHMNFDREGVPRRESGMVLSAWGRAIRFARSSEQVISRGEIIDVLMATRGLSEGVTADAILAAMLTASKESVK